MAKVPLQSYASWTPEERDAVESAMRELSPDYRLFDWDATVAALKASTRGDEKEQDALLRIITDDFDFGDIPEPHWWILMWQLLFPDIRPDPWGEVKWWIWNDSRGKGETVMFHGSQNSAKSSWCGHFIVTQMIAWKEEFGGYVTGPYKEHADDKVWLELSLMCRRIHRAKLDARFGADLNVKRDVIIESNSGGQIKFTAVHEASSMQGRKTRNHDDPRKGIMIVAGDEIIENPNTSIHKGIANTRSNPNYFGALFCNPDPELVMQPKVRTFTEPVEKQVKAMDREKDVSWKTAEGRVARFWWNNCPNKILGRNEFPYLLNQMRVDRQVHQTDNIQAAQIYAWPFGASDGITDYARQESAGVFADFGIVEEQHRFLICDPAFTATGDPAVITELRSGLVDIVRADGSRSVEERIWGVEQFVMSERLDYNFKADQEFLDQLAMACAYCGTTPKPRAVGDLVGGQLQVAVYSALECRERGVQPSHFTFDASQRFDAGQAFAEVFGMGNIRWYYEGSRPLSQEETGFEAIWPQVMTMGKEGQRPMKWSERHSTVISMLWFLCAEALNRGIITGGSRVQRGIDEIASRPIETGRRGQGTGKRDVIGKKRLKEMKMKSPAYGETLAMGIYLATRYFNVCKVNSGDTTQEGPSTIGASAMKLSKYTRKGQKVRRYKRL